MARRPTRRASGGGSLPTRSLANHTLKHFEWFCGTLRLPDELGPFALEDYERTILTDYFAGIPENLWLLPTGQRKSMLLGALGLHCASYVRANARVFILGGLGGHGRNALDAAAAFVDRDPDRLGRWWVLQEYGMGRLKSLRDRGRIIVVSAGRRVGGRGGSTVEGEGPDLILVEELHRHEDDGQALATLQSKAQKKSHGGWIVPTVIVTTAGDTMFSALGRRIERATDLDAGAVVTQDRPGEYYRRGVDADGDLVMHEWAVPDDVVLPVKPDGTTEDRARYKTELLAFLAEVKKANPASFIRIDNLRRSLKALSKEPWVFLRQHCNQWVTQDFPAIDKLGWLSGKIPGLEIPAGAKSVFVGLDTATKWATTAIVPVWVDSETGRPRTAKPVILKSPHPGAQRRMRDAIDVLEVMRQRWPDMVVVFDRAYGGGLIAEQLEEDHGLKVVDHSQGAPFELASMLFGELVDQHGFDHDGNEELTSHVLSAVARRSRYGRRWRIDAPRDGRPIDGADAVVMATNIALNPPAPDTADLDLSEYRIEPL